MKILNNKQRASIAKYFKGSVSNIDDYEFIVSIIDIDGFIDEDLVLDYENRLNTDYGSVCTYNLYWMSGAMETIKGVSITDALFMAGYSANSIRQLDIYSDVRVDNGHTWDDKLGVWLHGRFE